MAPPKIGKNIYKFAAALLVGGVLFAVDGQNIIGSRNLQYEYDNSGSVTEALRVTDSEFYAYCNGTGGLSTYDVCIVRNPVTQRNNSAGSGVLLTLSLEVGNNPAGGGLDVVFATTANSDSGAVVIIDNFAAATGSWIDIADPIGWGSGDYIVVKSLTDLTSSFTGRLRGTYRDVYGQ